MWPIVTDGVAWALCRSVCHDHQSCKNGFTDRDAVWVQDSGGPEEPCSLLDRVHVGATWRIRLNRPCTATMPPYVKILWPLVIIRSRIHGALRYFSDGTMI